MKQNELERAVARRTGEAGWCLRPHSSRSIRAPTRFPASRTNRPWRAGESRRTIRRRGFSLLEEPPPADEVRLSLDCPGCGALVPLPHSPEEPLPELAESGRCEAPYPYFEGELTAREFPSVIAAERPATTVAFDDAAVADFFDEQIDAGPSSSPASGSTRIRATRPVRAPLTRRRSPASSAPRTGPS